ncbi:hypothetical protein Tco_0690981 [Tanacetum coccineum]
MLSEQFTSGSSALFLTPGYLVQDSLENLVSSKPYVPPFKKDYDILCQPLFDEYIQPPSSVVSLMLPAAA